MASDDGADPLQDQLLHAVRGLFDGLIAEPASRALLRSFAQQVVDLLSEEPPATAEAAAAAHVEPVATATPSDEIAEPEHPAEPVLTPAEAIQQLKWAQRSDTRLSPEEREESQERLETIPDVIERGGVSRRHVPDDELPLIAARATIKAEASRWKNRRRELLASSRRLAEDVVPRDQELIARANEFADCFLWMNYQDGPAAAARESWEIVADGFEATAAAALLLQEALEHAETFPELFQTALELAAEAQSSLRAACRLINEDDEPEQARLFHWLKRTTSERGHYIQRYMRVDDIADPTLTAGLMQRMESLKTLLEERRGNDRQRRKRLGQLKYLSGEIQSDPAADHGYHWQKLLEAVSELVALGEPPSSKEIRTRLLPILDDIPAGEITDNVALVLREIDRFMAENPSEEPAPAQAPVQRTPEIEEVARRIEGKTLVLIGGVRKPAHVQALQDAFRLKEVVWVPTREHQSVGKFEPFVRQPDVAVVVLAIRWTSHSYGDVKDFCDTYGKPFVRLKAGYNPVQVATQILEQVSDQLPPPAARSESA